MCSPSIMWSSHPFLPDLIWTGAGPTAKCTHAAWSRCSALRRCHHAGRVPTECPDSVRDLIAACMDADPAERPSACEIVEVLTSGDGKGLRQQKHLRRKTSTPEASPWGGSSR